MDLQALYSNACSREIGVIIGATQNRVYILNIRGQVRNLARYNISAIASYPINSFPINGVSLSAGSAVKIDQFTIKTKYKNNIVDLVNGWPIGFSNSKISFLSASGEEIIVDRNKIWTINVTETQGDYKFGNKVDHAYRFRHPASLASCGVEKKYAEEALENTLVYPQEFSSDPVTIKRKFDRIVREHEILKMYVRSQKFYPVPEVFGNRVTLGFWGAIGSRYGASESRSNNGAPVLVDEFSTGPFGYQHVFVSGAAPNSLLMHEEPQTQLFYQFKADYFHLSALYDPSEILVGNKYSWQENEFDDGEFRFVESSLFEAGIDIGKFALLFIPQSSAEIGVRFPSNGKTEYDFGRTGLGIKRIGLRYRNRLFQFDIHGGQGIKTEPQSLIYRFDPVSQSDVLITIPEVKYELSYIRLNGQTKSGKKANYGYSFIQRQLQVNDFQATSTSNAVFLDYLFNYKYKGKVFFAHEKVKSSQFNHDFFKLGINVSIIF